MTSISDTKHGADSAVPDCGGFFHSFLLHFQDLQTATRRGTKSNHRYGQWFTCVVDRQRFITIRMRLSILMPIRIRILPQVLHLLENQISFYFCLQQCQFSLFLVCVIGGIIFNILDRILKFAGKKNSLALHLVEKDRLCQIDADPTGSTTPEVPTLLSRTHWL